MVHFSLPKWYVSNWKAGLYALTKGRISKEILLRFLDPLPYYRCIEIPWVVSAMELPQYATVLDVASPKFIGVWLAGHFDLNIVLTDISDYFTVDYKLFAAALSNVNSQITMETQDARHMTYRDGSFHVVYSVSVLEHIPDDGDSVAIREMERVTKPGGRFLITVPFRQTYAEAFVTKDVYERKSEGSLIHWSRYYDLRTLNERLISQVKNSHLVSASIFRHRPLGYRILFGTPKPLRALRFVANPLHARVGFRRVTSNTRDFLDNALIQKPVSIDRFYGKRAEEVERQAQPFGVACIAFKKDGYD